MVHSSGEKRRRASQQVHESERVVVGRVDEEMTELLGVASLIVDKYRLSPPRARGGAQTCQSPISITRRVQRSRTLESAVSTLQLDSTPCSLRLLAIVLCRVMQLTISKTEEEQSRVSLGEVCRRSIRLIVRETCKSDDDRAILNRYASWRATRVAISPSDNRRTTTSEVERVCVGRTRDGIDLT